MLQERVDRLEKTLCVTGCPRSGTRYFYRVLSRAHVLGVRHEHMGEEGTVNGLWAVNDTQGRNRHKRDDYVFEHRWHQTRHPLQQIVSMREHFKKTPSFWVFQEKHTGVPALTPSWREGSFEREARFWLEWNALAGAWCQWQYRIEDVEEVWPRMMNDLKRPGTAFPQGLLKNVNACVHEEIGWDDLGEWAEPVRKRAVEYGYEE